ncbi:MAG TPA: hypothetical protein VHE80_01510 [Acidimicrobiales bacterium]|nr:hypothetical protein [Acidimicrobiales bacterium]
MVRVVELVVVVVDPVVVVVDCMVDVVELEVVLETDVFVTLSVQYHL